MIDIKDAIWLFPVAFMVHDFEEILFVETWRKKNAAYLKAKLPERMMTLLEGMSITTAGFSVAVFLEFLVLCIITLSTSLLLPQKHFLLYSGALDAFFLHAFSHVGQSIWLRRWTPGVSTAVAVVIPYSIFAYWCLLHGGFVGVQEILTGIPIGLVLMGVLLWIGHKAGNKLFPVREFMKIDSTSEV